MTHLEGSTKRVFVVGCPRSGTTFVQSRLAAHPLVSTFPETKLLIELVGLRRSRMRSHLPRSFGQTLMDRARAATRRLGVSRPVRPEFAEKLREIGDHLGSPEFLEWEFPWTLRLRTLVGYAVSRFDAFAAREGSLGWIEKTPLHVFYTREIERYVPGAHFFHVVRDGRATVASIREAVSKGYPFWEKDYPDIDASVEIWNASLARTVASVGRPNHHVVNYHRFAEDPEGHARAIWDTIGLPPADTSDDARESTAAAVMPNEEWKSKVGEKTRDYGLEKFREMFPEDEQARIESMLRDHGELSALGG